MSVLLLLQERGLITDEVLAKINQLVSVDGKPVEEALLQSGIEAATVRTTSAEYYQVPAFEITEGLEITAEVLSYIPEDSALHYHIVPLQIADDILVVGVNDPDDLQIREALNFISTKHNIPYKMVFMLMADIVKAQEFYSNLKGEVTDALVSLETELDTEIAKNSAEGEEGEEANFEHIKEDAPVTKIVATILRYAVDGKVSDIHIEPNEK